MEKKECNVPVKSIKTNIHYVQNGLAHNESTSVKTL